MLSIKDDDDDGDDDDDNGDDENPQASFIMSSLILST